MTDKPKFDEIAGRLLGRLQRMGPRTSRALGAALGSVMPKVDVSALDRDDPLQRAFADGFLDGKTARSVGDLLTAATKPNDDDDEDEP